MFLQEQVEHLVIKGKYDYQRLLRESMKAIVTFLDLDELLQHIISSISQGLRTEQIHLYLKGEKGLYCARLSPSGKQAPQIDAALIQWLERNNQVMIKQEFEMAAPQDEQFELYRCMEQGNIELIVPLLYKGQISGFLTLGKKGTKDSYVKSDIELLESMASHAAVAIENARLYDETRRMSQSYQESEAKFRTLADTAAVAVKGERYIAHR